MLMQAYGGSAICIENIESTRPVRLSFESGHTLPPGNGATGKLLLAYMTERERTALPDERSAIDPEFASRREALEKDLPQIAKQGWATSHAEIEEGVWACRRDSRRREGPGRADRGRTRIPHQREDPCRGPGPPPGATADVSQLMIAYRGS